MGKVGGWIDGWIGSAVGRQGKAKAGFTQGLG